MKKIIAEQLGVDEDEVMPEASFVEDLGADSLDTVELVMAFEEEFDIEIPDEDAEKILTVGKAMEYIKEKVVSRTCHDGYTTARRMVVTGIGLVTPLGIGTGAKRGKRSAPESRASARITRFDPTDYPAQIAGEVKDFDPAAFIEKKEIKKMDIVHPFCRGGCAVGGRGCRIESDARRSGPRVGVYIGSGIGGLCSIETYHKVLKDKGPGSCVAFLHSDDHHQPGIRASGDPT